MKTLAEAAMELPWLAPNVASMTSLAKAPLSSSWDHLRTDPGILLLVARSDTPPSDESLQAHLLEALLRHQPDYAVGTVPWDQDGPNRVLHACIRHGWLASQLARALGIEDRRAWIAGFLAPLGWLAIAAVEPSKISAHLELLNKNTDPTDWQRQAWGQDHTGLTRRLCRAWRLPAWLSATIGHLGLPPNIAERVGAPTQLFTLVQATALLLEERGAGLGLLPVGDSASLLSALNLLDDEADDLVESSLNLPAPRGPWTSPADCPLLADLLQLALENRRQNDAGWIERLHKDLDCLQHALAQQCADEKNRLQSAKLAALAEFAAGAGHEINNPLAVISGQAQYVLKQMDWLDVPAEEIENLGEYLEGLRAKIAPSLTKIIGQTQRIHSILTELMQFARPSKPKVQALSARSLIQEVTHNWQTLADQRKVRVAPLELLHDEILHADLAQARTALGALLRNAIEATPEGGWVGVRVEKKNGQFLDLIVENSGAGIANAVREHLFDPFFSGRSAGRGRGMGLPTAWRFARQHGGDVRFDGHHHGITRFVLSLPLAPVTAIPTYTTGNPRNGIHPPIEAAL